MDLRSMYEKRKASEAEQLAIAKATFYQGLDPVDTKRCMAESKESQAAFRLGDPPKHWVRCDRKPSIVAIEPKQDRSKVRGAMSLCRSCAVQCEERHKDRDYIFVPAAPFKAAFAIGGHQAVRDMIYAYKRDPKPPRAPTGLRARSRNR